MSKILFIGDSITDAGYYVGLVETFLKLRPQLGAYEFDNIGLSSENTSGLSESGHPFKRPCIFTRIDKILKYYTSEIAIVMYGINDGIYGALSDERFDAYKIGIKNLVTKIKATGMKVWLCTPTIFDSVSCKCQLCEDVNAPPRYGKIYSEYNDVMTAYAKWIRTEMTTQVDKIIDINSAMTNYLNAMREKNPAFKFNDGIHPDINMSAAMGNCLLSEGFSVNGDLHKELKNGKFNACYKLVYKRQRLLHCYEKELIEHTSPWHDKVLPKDKLDKSVSKLNLKVRKICGMHISDKQYKWTPCNVDKFVFRDLEAVVVMPEKPNIKRELLWRTEFFGSFPDADKIALSRGFHVVYLNNLDNYGSKQSVDTMKAFHSFVVKKYNLNSKITFLGLSRGALSAVNFAAEYRSCVRGIILDSPVVDIRSWPKGDFTSSGSPDDWQKLQQAYRIINFDSQKYETSLNEKLSIIAKNKIPTVVLSNTNDTIVPYSENGIKIVNAYNGSNYLLEILRKDIGHHPHGCMSKDALDFIDNCNKA